MQQIGKLGRSSRSSVKAEASRENGKRADRPNFAVKANYGGFDPGRASAYISEAMVL
jgi:hypothetical protein